MMDTLTSLQVFREVAEGGSFVGAAERLGLSTAMASKHVAHLERRLGARLLNRSSRRLSLTEAGAAYLARCREALDLLRAGEAVVACGAEAPQGVLKVTAPVWCATRRFADLLAAYRDRYPQVVPDLRLENRRVDLVEEGYDLALRVTAGEPSPALIVRPLGGVRFHWVASPACLARAGPLETPADLATVGAVLPTYVNLETMTLHGPGGATASPRLAAAMKSDDTTLSHHAVRAGIGAAFLPEWLVGDDLDRGTLRAVLPGWTAPPMTLYAAYTSRKYLTAKVRTFIDFLGESLGSDGA
jgi:DNA-binding transcriptional LysR family regulator